MYEYEYDSILYNTVDDSGTTYYFKGNPQNNYVNFGGMCYRIVRIQGDGSIKIILEDKKQVCENSIEQSYYGESELKEIIKDNKYLNKLKQNGWCEEKFEANKEIKNLRCGSKLNFKYIGNITLEEIVF